MDTNHSNAATSQAHPPLAVSPPPNPMLAWWPGNGAWPHLFAMSLPDITAEGVCGLAGPLRLDLCLYHELVVIVMTTKEHPQHYAMVWAALDDAGHIVSDPTGDEGSFGLVVIEHTTGQVLVSRQLAWPRLFRGVVEAQLAKRQIAPITRAEAQRRIAQMRVEHPGGHGFLERSIASCEVGF